MATELAIRVKRKAANDAILQGLTEKALRQGVTLPPFPAHLKRFDSNHSELFVLEWFRDALRALQIIPTSLARCSLASPDITPAPDNTEVIETHGP